MTRERIREHVAAHPGRHFNAVTRALDLAPGQVQYHLGRLRTEGAVVEEHLYGRTHYFPPEFDPPERRRIAVLRRETARDVLVELLDGGPAAPADVAARVGVARSTLEHHLDHLCEQSLVAKRRDEQNRVTLTVPEERAALAALAAVEPSLPERMVDRFARLVDNLLAE